MGSINADLVISVPRLPLPGETLAGSSDLRFVPGGKGANTAAAAARLLRRDGDGDGGGGGSRVHLIGQLGGDAYAAPLRQALAEAGVELQHVREVDGAATGTAIILLQPSGENSIILSPAANARWPAGDSAEQIFTAEARESIASAGALLMMGTSSWTAE